MKANRRVRGNDDAVSPVIAVILMVAITVVLAATVYLWVSGFGNNQNNVVNASFAAKSIDLPWTNADTDTTDDAIELTYTSGSGDLSNTDVTMFIDGTSVTWDTSVTCAGAATCNFIQGGSFTAGQVCSNSPGADINAIWERGSSIYLLKTGTTAAPAGPGTKTTCGGTISTSGGATLAGQVGSLSGIHLLKVVVKGQVVLDTQLEVHDNAAA